MSTTTTLFGSAEAQVARALVGGTTLGDTRNELLKQILVATANKAGGSSSVAFASITGAPTDNAALAAALAAKLDLAGGIMTGALAVESGTLNSASISSSQEWNNAGVTCRGLEVAVTDTNSAAGSTLLRLLGGAAGTTEILTVDKNGKITNDGPAFGNFDIFAKAGSNRSIQIIADGAGSVILGGTNVTSFVAYSQRGTAGFGTARNSQFRFSSVDGDDNGSSGAIVCSGSGDPEGAKTAPPGSIYLNQAGGSGTSLYYKSSGTGNTGWSAVA